MKKLIIILSFFCLFPFMVLGQDTSQSTSKDEGLKLSKELEFKLSAIGFTDGVWDTNYNIPEPFGIKLGQLLNEKLIIEKDDDNEFYVNPKIKNNIFDEYKVRTKFNNVIAVNATAKLYGDDCLRKKKYLLTKLKTKYSQGTLRKNGMWRFIQGEIFEYESGEAEWIYEFQIELWCTDKTLFLGYYLHKGELNFDGID